MGSFLQAWRALARRPTFTLLAVFTLALGITITTTAFSVLDSVLLRPLPYPEGDRLVALYEANPSRGQRTSLIAPVRLDEWHRLNRTFAALSGSYSENITDTSGVEPERIAGRRVMPRFFEVFGMAPLAGRTFVASEEQFGGAGAAVIGEDYWARRFGRSPAAIGARMMVGGAGYTIVGVMPRAFAAAGTDVWLPAQLSPQMLQVRQARFLVGVGRLRAGVTPQQGRDDLARVQADLGRQYPQSDKDWSADVRDMKDVRIGDSRRPIVVLFAAVALLFAIAIANVAGLVLVQLHRRSAEFAIRAAIGASRLQVFSGVMREIAVLSFGGVVLGAAGAYWLTGALANGTWKIPRIAEVSLDERALAFAIVSSVLAAVLFGGVPALAASSRGPARALASLGRGVAGGSHRLQGAIVVFQLALGVVLAGSAGLLVRSYTAMTRVDPGFAPGGVLTFHVGASWDEDRARVGQFQERLIEALRAMPGARDAGFANFLPTGGATLRYQVTVEGLASDEQGGAFTIGLRTVTPGYLRALSVPLAAGNWCAETRANPRAGTMPEAMVNRTFVERHAAGQHLVGRRLKMTQGGEFQIAGVIADVHEDGAAAPPFPYVYTCLRPGAWPDPEYVVRADGDPRALAAAIRAAVRALDPARPVFGMKTLGDALEASLEQPRLNATALGGFAIAALALAALGLYGLLMLLVSQRRQELGVRMALGATPRELAGVVIAGAGRLVGVGVAAGLGLAIGAGYLLRSLLFGVTPFDAAALSGGVAALTVIAAVAVLIPARQAARATAMDAMRATD